MQARASAISSGSLLTMLPWKTVMVQARADGSNYTRFQTECKAITKHRETCYDQGPWFIESTSPAATLVSVPALFVLLCLQREENSEFALVWEVQTLKEGFEHKICSVVVCIEFGACSERDSCDEFLQGGCDGIPYFFWATGGDVILWDEDSGEGGIHEGAADPAGRVAGVSLER